MRVEFHNFIVYKDFNDQSPVYVSDRENFIQKGSVGLPIIAVHDGCRVGMAIAHAHRSFSQVPILEFIHIGIS